MEMLQYSLRKLVSGIPLILGVTLVSFLLMVYFGPDQTYALLGKNPTQEQIDEIRHELGYDKPFVMRYADYLRELATLDFGRSNSTGERVDALLARTIPISLALVTPGFASFVPVWSSATMQSTSEDSPRMSRPQPRA